MWTKWQQAFKRISTDINNTPWKRRTAIGAFMALYTATGIAGYQYLQDTRYRATGEPSPYKPRNPGSETSATPQVVEPHDTTPVYDKIAAEYDSKIGMEEITSYVWWMRRRVAKHIYGDALEISCGTGRNIGWLYPKKIHSLTFLDPSRAMLQAAETKFDKYSSKYDGKPVQFVQGAAENLLDLTAKSNQRFDTVFETFGLCSHEDPDRALQEMAAMLKPGGQLVFLEHGRGTYESMNKRMDLRAKERAEEWGCRWNLDIKKIVENSGLRIVEQDNYHFGTMYFYVLKVPKSKK